MKLARPIVQQQQPNDLSCVPTCIAMALGVPVAELGLALNRAYEIEQLGVFLAARAVWLRICDRGEQFRRGHLYIVEVPSLNDMAQSHCVLVDNRGVSAQTIDPQTGNRAKKDYKQVDETIALYFCRLEA